MIRILLVEDNAIVRKIMEDMVVMQDDLEIAGAAANGFEALALLRNGIKADIVLADLNMQGMDGIELTRNITAIDNKLKVIIFTMHDKATYLKRALEAGARGYLLKNGDMEELYEAVRKVLAGELVIGKEANN
jgi:DNA-binding NarL/FixJ family response regulator